MPAGVRGEASAKVEEMAAEVARPEPHKRAVAERLAELTKILTSAGALVAAGTGVGGPLVALVGWLGQLGEPISRLLRR